MKRAFFIFIAMMVYAVWAAAQSSPTSTPWWSHFRPVPSGTVLVTQTPAVYTPTPTNTLVRTPMPSPSPSVVFIPPTRTATATPTNGNGNGKK